MKLKYGGYVPALISICRKAGLAIMEIYEDESKFGVEQKDDKSPLTRADKLANAIICNGLRNINSNIPIISEENKEIPYEERKNFEYCWVVDPLDGTKEFIKRNGEFTVNIALIHKDTPVMGFVYVPVSQVVYYGIKDRGSFKLDGGHVEKIVADEFSMDNPYLTVVCSRSHLNDATQAFLEKLKNPRTEAAGSSLKFMLLAEGDAHVYPRLAPTMEWDTAAAQIVLEEAGGSVISEDTKEPLKYNKENLLNPYFIAYGDKK